MSVDNRVVSMKFDKAAFLSGISETISALEKLKTSLKMDNASKGLNDISSTASRFSLSNVTDGFSRLSSGISALASPIDTFKKGMDFSAPAKSVEELNASTGRFSAANIVDGFGKVAFGISALASPIDTFKKGMQLEGGTKGLDDINAATGRFSVRGMLDGIFSVSSGIKALNSPVKVLDDSLKLEAGAKGIKGVNAEVGKFSMAGMANQVTSVTTGFTTMQVVATTALATVVSQATTAGAQIVKSLSLKSVMDGFSDYELKVKATQTLMNGTGENIGVVSAALKELDIYADETIYSLSDMVNNIGKFTNAGVSLDKSVGAMIGISNAAALAGAGTEEAAIAMRNLGQAMGKGVVTAADWISIDLANMGTKEFKEQLIEAGVAAGTLTKANDGTVKSLKGNEVTFKNMKSTLEDQWLTADVLTASLNRYADKTTDIGGKAFKAAKDVKTFSMMMTTLKAAAGTGWTDTFEIVVGNLPESIDLFTSMTNTFGELLGASADARNELLKGWKDLGGRTVLIEAFKNAWGALLSVIRPIKEAFREIFPAQTSQGLYDLTVRLRDFTESLKIGDGTAEGLKRTFKGVFALFSIAGQILGGVVEAFKRMFGAVGDNSGGILNFTGNIGDFLVSVDAMLKKSGIITKVFGGIGDVFGVLAKLLGGIGGLIAGIFTGFDTKGVEQLTGALDTVNKRVDPLKAAGDKIQRFFGIIAKTLGQLGTEIKKGLVAIKDTIAGAFTTQMFDKSLDVINTGLLGGIVLLLRNFVKGGLSVNVGEGMFGQIKDTLGAVQTTLVNMQTSIKADILLKIAGALALLTASIVVLSLIDSEKLKGALAGIGVSFIGLQVALISLSKFISFAGMAKLPFITASLVALATGILILSVALKILSTINFADSMQTLVLLGGSMLILSLAMKSMSKNSGGMIRAAAALTILGVALNLIAVALKIFATMEWDEIARGLTAMAGSMAVLIAAMRLMPKNMAMQAVALGILAGALNGIAIAMKIFSTMSYESMARGLVALAGSLVIIAGAMRIMPPNMLLQSVALIAVAGALNTMAIALKIMGSMGWEEVAKGMVVLAGSMAILAIALNAMSGTLLGAAALTAAAVALTLLAPVLITLGSLSWDTIVKGLTAIAGVFVILGVAGYLLAPVVPVIVGLAAAMVLVGAGLALAGAGALAFGTGFALVVSTGTAGVKVLADMLGTFVKAIPEALKQFAKGIVNFIIEIGKGAPAFIAAFTAIIKAALQSIIVTAPKIGEAFLVLLKTGLKVLVDGVPAVVDAGLKLVLGLLKGIADNIYRIVKTVSQIVQQFLKALGEEVPKLIDSGVKFIISFINGVADGIRKNQRALENAGINLADAIIDGMVSGLKRGAQAVINIARNVARDALNAAKDFLGISSPSKEFIKVGKYSDEGFAMGLSKYASIVGKEAEGVGNEALTALQGTMSNLSGVISGDIDLSPVVSPVIDLSQFRKDAGQMSGLLSATPLSAAVSYRNATSISAIEQANRMASDQSISSEPIIKEIKFEQTNISPKALSSVDIYRNTRSQIAFAKEALSV